MNGNRVSVPKVEYCSKRVKASRINTIHLINYKLG